MLLLFSRNRTKRNENKKPAKKTKSTVTNTSGLAGHSDGRAFSTTKSTGALECMANWYSPTNFSYCSSCSASAAIFVLAISFCAGLEDVLDLAMLSDSDK